MKNVTMKDIADRLGISVVAVSKALNHKEGVSEALRVKILKTAGELGYRYSAKAALPQSRLSHNVGVVVAERFVTEDSFYFKYFRSISAMLQERGFYAVFLSLSSTEEEALLLPQAYDSGKLDAFIVLGQVSGDYSRLLRSTGLPMLFLDFYDDNPAADCIIGDNFYAAYELTNLLVGRGHRRIAYVGSITATSSIEDRYLGYYKSLLEHSIPLREDYVIPDRDAHGRYIELSLPDDMPTAFVCNCDEIACRLIVRLREMGLSVPGDISVVGFDNSVYSSVSDPQITTVEVSTEEMSKLAADYILRKIADPAFTFGRIHVNGRIIEKASVGAAD